MGERFAFDMSWQEELAAQVRDWARRVPEGHLPPETAFKVARMVEAEHGLADGRLLVTRHRIAGHATTTVAVYAGAYDVIGYCNVTDRELDAAGPLGEFVCWLQAVRSAYQTIVEARVELKPPTDRPSVIHVDCRPVSTRRAMRLVGPLTDSDR